MKSFKQLREELDHFQSEKDISESTLREIYDGIVFIASKERQTSLGASLFHALKPADKLSYFNTVVLDLYKKSKYPVPGKSPYLKFQQSVKDLWRGIKKNPGADYYDYEIIKKSLGLK